MRLQTLRSALVSFANNPGDSWGQGTDGYKNPADLSTGFTARVTPDTAEINTARLNSCSYTKEQHDDFERQLRAVERRGYGTAHFPGDPNRLPESVPERACACGRTFRSLATKDDAACFECELALLCPILPGRRIQVYWTQGVWQLSAFGDVGLHNEVTYWWYNPNSGGNVCHQGLVVKRTPEGVIRTMVFSTVASNENRCYVVTFDLEADTVTLAVRNSRTVKGEEYGDRLETQELEPLVLDFIVAMTPAWMLYTHRPRDPRNGCFA